MIINHKCPNRIKPILLREQKTEALLVFVRTLVEQLFIKIQKENSVNLQGKNIEDTKCIYTNLKNIKEELEKSVVPVTYLKSLIANKNNTNKAFRVLFDKEEPLIVYYNSLLKVMESKLSIGQRWLPEVIIISTLSQWVLEEEKSSILYPFLNEVDYIDLIDRFDKIKNEQKSDKKELIMNMYKLSAQLIEHLNESSYKKTFQAKQKATKKSKKRK